LHWQWAWLFSYWSTERVMRVEVVRLSSLVARNFKINFLFFFPGDSFIQENLL
jgi:hypothetical protein